MRKTRINANIVIYVFLVLILCENVFADTLYLQNGTQFKGKVIKQDSEKVVFRVGEGEDGTDVTFFNDEILRIDKAEISSFIKMPLGDGKEISIPRPDLPEEPLLTGKARKQIEKNKEDLDKTELISNEPEQEVVTFDIEKGKAIQKEESIVEELLPLFDQNETEYFLRINSIAKEYVDKTFQVLGLDSLNQNEEELKQLIQNIPQEIDSTIEKINKLQIPPLFSNLHNKHLANFNFIKEIFTELSKGDGSVSMEKLQKLQDMSAELVDELENILEQKKASDKQNL